MISAFYASLAALLIVKLSLDVMKIRRIKKINIGEGEEDKQLQFAIRTYANAIEYIPITLILLFALELNGGTKPLVHALGVVFITGRVLHAFGQPFENLSERALGMQITLCALVVLVFFNVIYLVIH